MDWRRKAGDHDARVDAVEQRGNRVAVVFSWADSNEKRHDWAQVLELTDDHIVSIHDYARPSRAALAARLRAVVA